MPRQSARRPEYSGTESGSWSDVDKTWEAFHDGYYANTDEDPPDERPNVADAPETVRQWVAARTLVGVSDADEVGELIVLPVVNPSTDQLNQNGLRAAITFAPQVDGLSEDGAESAQDMARTLLEEEFDEDASAYSYALIDGKVYVRAPMEALDFNAKQREPVMSDDSPGTGSYVQKDLDDAGDTPAMEPADEKNLPYEVKDAGSGTVKDVDVQARTITGYYASFGNVDMDDDVFVQGAFEESIREWGPDADQQRITHLNQHQATQPIGLPQVLKEDDFGLYFETDVFDTRLGEDVLKLYRGGVFEHSVGFRRLGEEQRDDAVTLITKAQLWEGSNVTWGANPQTPFMGFKSAMEVATKMADQISALESVLKEGLTDATAYQIELGLQQMKARLRKLQDQLQEDEDEDQKAPQELIDPLGGRSFFDVEQARRDHQKEREQQNRSTFFPDVN